MKRARALILVVALSAAGLVFVAWSTSEDRHDVGSGGHRVTQNQNYGGNH